MEQYPEYREHLGYSTKAVASLRQLDRYVVTENVTTLKALTPLFFLQMWTDLAIDQNTINRVLYALHGFFQYLVRIEFCQYNPLADIPRFKENNIYVALRSEKVQKLAGDIPKEENKLTVKTASFILEIFEGSLCISVD